jgi:hypothetical protein
MGSGEFGYAGGFVSFLPLVIIGVVLLFIVIPAVARGRRGSNASLILEEFNFFENEDEFLKIKGRAAGFWNWILSLFGKAPMTNLTFDKQLFKYEEFNIKNNIPLLNITRVSYGMLKSSLLLLVLGIIFSIFGLAMSRMTTGIPIILGILMIIVWALNRKTMHFGIYVNENAPMVTIKMKRGIINSLDLNKFESSAKVLTEIILNNTKAK